MNAYTNGPGIFVEGFIRLVDNMLIVRTQTAMAGVLFLNNKRRVIMKNRSFTLPLLATFVALALSVMVLAITTERTEITTKYYCPKCGSTDLETKCTDPPPKVILKSMDKIGEQYTVYDVLPMIRYSSWQTQCKRCGYTVEWTMP